MCAAQAIDCRAPLAPGRGVAAAHQRVRELIPPLERDRVLSTDIAEIAAAVRRGVFATSAAQLVA
jgi:histidine ammonia-lyase